LRPHRELSRAGVPFVLSVEEMTMKNVVICLVASLGLALAAGCGSSSKGPGATTGEDGGEEGTSSLVGSTDSGSSNGTSSGSNSGGGAPLPNNCVLYPASCVRCDGGYCAANAGVDAAPPPCAANTGVGNPGGDAATPASDSGCSGQGDATRAAMDGG